MNGSDINNRRSKRQKHQPDFKPAINKEPGAGLEGWRGREDYPYMDMVGVGALVV